MSFEIERNFMHTALFQTHTSNHLVIIKSIYSLNFKANTKTKQTLVTNNEIISLEKYSFLISHRCTYLWNFQIKLIKCFNIRLNKTSKFKILFELLDSHSL